MAAALLWDPEGRRARARELLEPWRAAGQALPLPLPLPGRRACTARGHELDESAAFGASVLVLHDVGVKHGAHLLAQVLELLWQAGGRRSSY